MNMRDYATGVVLTAPSPADSGTSLVLQSGEGARMPDVPFYATVHPPSEFPTLDNSEKVKVTAISADTLTIERGQGETSAQSIEPGWRLSNALFYKDVKPVAVTVSTDATTAAKVGVTSTANYVPEAGDMLSVTFSSGCNVASPTLNIDGSGAKNIRLGNVNVSTSLVSTASALTLPMWYDGTYYNIYGSLKNDNTTYSEISTAEITNTTNTETRLISGRRAEYLMANEATKTRTLTGKTIDGGSNTLTVLAGTQLSGTVPIANGGTNASTASGARTNLGMGTMATKDGTGFQTLTVASSAPSSPATGDIWIDTSSGISTSYYVYTISTIYITSTSTVDIPDMSQTIGVAGTYIINLTGNVLQYNNLDQFPRIGIYVNNTRVAYSAVRVQSGGQFSYAVVTKQTLSVNDVVKVCCSNGQCVLFEGQHMTMVRQA